MSGMLFALLPAMIFADIAAISLSFVHASSWLALTSFASSLIDLSNRFSLAINSVVGHSWMFDNVLGFFRYNDLAKGGVIGCCFLAAWYGAKSRQRTTERRKILITTLVAAVFVIGTTKLLSHTIFLPRPDIQSQKIYRLEGDQLIEMKRAPIHVPLDETSQKDHRALLNGDIDTNDLGSFPSDHAGFFVAVSLGIWLACRRLGWLALGWTVLVIMGGKIIGGEHTFLDVTAGAAIAIGELSIVQYIAKKQFGWLLDKLTPFTLRYSALFSALIFLVAFEISSTLIHVRAFLGLLAAMRRHVVLGI